MSMKESDKYDKLKFWATLAKFKLSLMPNFHKYSEPWNDLPCSQWGPSNPGGQLHITEFPSFAMQEPPFRQT